MPVTNRRIYQWDNVKGILILLMVMGHFASYVMEDQATIRTFYMYVYIFHMPLFMFISGIFAAGTVETGKGLRRKVAGYLLLTLFIKFLLFAVRYPLGGVKNLNIFSPWGIEWYIFVLAIYLVVTYLLREMDRRVLLAFALVTALFIGYDKKIGADWSLSRLFVFYPYFLAGTLWDKRDYRLPKAEWRKLARPVAALIMLLVLILVRLRIDTITSYENLLLGYRPYANFMENTQLGWLWRLVLYGAAALLSVCLVLLTPTRKSFLTTMGVRSLQIYVLHRPILYFLDLVGYQTLLSHIWPAHWKVLFMLTSVLLTLVLVHPVLEVPFRWFLNQFENME